MMNELIRQLAEQATSIVEMVGPQGYTSSYANFDRELFAELIIRECKRAARGEIVEDFFIDEEDDPLHREYLKGNNGGVVDSIVAIQEHFYGVEE